MRKVNKNKATPAYKQGFTLLELLVVIFIVGLISSMLVANWRKGEKQYLLQRTAQEIVQNIRKAQDMALTSFRYEGEIPSNYGIYFNIQESRSSYKIFADDNGNQKYNSGERVGEDIILEQGIEINSLSSGSRIDITFSLPDSFTHIEPSANSATIAIKKAGGTCPQNCKNIIIINTGQVNIE